MKRIIASLVLAVAATPVLASVALGQPITEPASCNGYLASWASPNNGFIVQEIVLPTAAELGVTPGAILSGFAQLHLGGLEPCIP
jgi:hypothetical protein